MKYLKKGIATLIAVFYISFSSLGQCEYVDSIKYYADEFESISQAYAFNWLQNVALSEAPGSNDVLLFDDLECRSQFEKYISIPNGDIFSQEIELFASKYQLTANLFELKRLATNFRNNKERLKVAVLNENIEYVHTSKGEIELLEAFLNRVKRDYENNLIKKDCLFVLYVRIADFNYKDIIGFMDKYFKCQCKTE